MRTTVTVEEVSRDPIPEDLFRPPANDQETKPDRVKDANQIGDVGRRLAFRRGVVGADDFAASRRAVGSSRCAASPDLYLE